MAKKKHLKVLFIGNSHTYYHDLPAWVALMAREEGYDCDVTMLAHGGWYLHQHVKEPDVRFNIKYGHYDYVVLQEHSHPFDDIPGYIEAATTLSSWIRNANVKHFFTLLGNEFFTSYGKQFFTWYGKMFFTLYGKQFFTFPGKEIFTSLSGSRQSRQVLRQLNISGCLSR